MKKTASLCFLFAITASLNSSTTTSHVSPQATNSTSTESRPAKKSWSRLKCFAIGSVFVSATVAATYYYKDYIKGIVPFIQKLYAPQIVTLSDQDQTAKQLLTQSEHLTQLRNNYQSALAILEALRELLKKETERKKKAQFYRDRDIDYWRNHTSIENNIHALTLKINTQVLHVKSLKIELDEFTKKSLK